MKLVIFFLFTLSLFGYELDEWELERTNFYFENDIFSKTDSQYTAGGKLVNIYTLPKSSFFKIPFLSDYDKEHFFSMGIAQQVFTPDDINASKLITDDRPYAGWLYLEFGIHQTGDDQLDSLLLQIGAIGKLSGAEGLQTEIHKITGSSSPNGWKNQLHSEIGINLTYQHKWHINGESYLGMSSDLVPYYSVSLGNVKTQLSSGLFMRFGWNILQDYGSSHIGTDGENGIPLENYGLCKSASLWSFTFNFGSSLRAVAYDIFLDGNSLHSSHSVDKENLIVYGSYGFTARYQHLTLDYILTTSTSHFVAEKSTHKFGTILLSYLY